MRRGVGLALVAIAIGAGIAILNSRPDQAPPQQRRLRIRATGRCRAGGESPACVDDECGASRPAATFRKAAIAFADGTTIPIELRPTRLVSLPFPVPERLANRYADLVRLAEQGDAGCAGALQVAQDLRTRYGMRHRCSGRQRDCMPIAS